MLTLHVCFGLQGLKFAIIHALVALVAIVNLGRRNKNKVDLGGTWGLQDCSSSAISLDIINIVVSIILSIGYVSSISCSISFEVPGDSVHELLI